MLYIFGDPHINDSKPWFVKASNSFIEWLNNASFNNPTNECLFLGDMTESFLNTGNVNAMLHGLFNICRFRKVYILVGNHDLKKHTVSGEHLTYEFVKNLDPQKFVILSEPAQELEIDGLKTLSLPYFSNIENMSMQKYYENLPASILAKTYDLVIGHILDDSVPTRMDPIKIHGKVKSKVFAFGHIHTVIGDKYLGSLFPVKSNENGKRIMRVVAGNGVYKDYDLPNFCEYIDVEYPSALPETKSMHPVYSVYGAPSLDAVRKLYGYEIDYHKTYPYTKARMQALFKNKDFVVNATKDDFNILSTKKLTLQEVLSSYMKDNPEQKIDREMYSLVMKLPS